MKTLQIARPGPEGKLIYGLFDAFGNSKAVEGNPAVEQFVAKLLLTDLGSDVDHPRQGGSLRLRMSEQVTETNLRTRISEMTRVIVLVEEQIRGSEAGLPLSPSERLSRIDILAINFSFAGELWTIRLHILMEDGNVARVLLS